MTVDAVNVRLSEMEQTCRPHPRRDAWALDELAEMAAPSNK